jgi:S-DNA-T family DNA segregation ATPase FtsK/SpoIIIE
MTNILIAGSTGSGKSVFINSILASLLYKSTPKDLRLVLIDTKGVEMSVYNGVPNLLVPIVSNPKKGAGALWWVVGEVTKRYNLLKEKGVKNIEQYNKFCDDIALPDIAVVIDDFADLMNIAPRETEGAACHIASLGRAVGIHLIISTQHPSNSVVTMAIKNNIISRIAFKMASGLYSRMVLDEVGAEDLAGMGDMLFKTIGAAKPRRVQGCFVSDEEVEKVVSFIKENGEADYDESLNKEIERMASDDDTSSDSGDEGGEVDALFNKAIEACIEAGQASTAMLQHRLDIGYARAGRLIDQLEIQGFIGRF